MRDDWSNAEKKVARRAFETARQSVLAAAFTEFKAKAAAATTVDDMWSIGDELRQRQRELEDLLDYRYSRLTFVFGRLIFAGHLDEKQLAGMSDDKLEDVRRCVLLLRSR